MKAPRVLDADERLIIRRALEAAAATSRVTLARMRTSELLSRDAQTAQRDALQLLAHRQELLAVAINDPARSLVLVAGDVLPPTRSKTRNSGG